MKASVLDIQEAIGRKLSCEEKDFLYITRITGADSQIDWWNVKSKNQYTHFLKKTSLMRLCSGSWEFVDTDMDKESFGIFLRTWDPYNPWVNIFSKRRGAIRIALTYNQVGKLLEMCLRCMSVLDALEELLQVSMTDLDRSLSRELVYNRNT